jgi:hypothetical protein
MRRVKMDKFHVIKVYYSDTINIRVNTHRCLDAESAALKYMAKNKPNTIVDAYDTILAQEGECPLGYQVVIGRNGRKTNIENSNPRKVFLIKTATGRDEDYEEVLDKVFLDEDKATRYLETYNNRIDERMETLARELQKLEEENSKSDRRWELEEAIDKLSKEWYADLYVKDISE